jgi:hypothetical protein
MIAGWFLSGKAPQDYAVETDMTERHSGTRSARMRALVEQPRDFGTLMQQVLADDFRGRIRLSGWVKTSNIATWCGLWLRVDSNDRILALDDMSDRPIQGTTDWGRHDLVLDVSDQATLILFGLVMAGAGTAWVDEITLERVDTNVPLTGALQHAPRQPRNLSFEE